MQVSLQAGRKLLLLHLGYAATALGYKSLLFEGQNLLQALQKFFLKFSPIGFSLNAPLCKNPGSGELFLGHLGA